MQDIQKLVKKWDANGVLVQFPSDPKLKVWWKIQNTSQHKKFRSLNLTKCPMNIIQNSSNFKSVFPKIFPNKPAENIAENFQFTADMHFWIAN
jgi:hypothetical protein